MVPVSAAAVHEALADIVGREHLLSDPPVLERHAVDGLLPRAVARPATVEQVSRVLALCASERLAVSPRGSGSSLALGNPPRRLDLILDVGRLKTVKDYVPEDMVASAEAGLTLGALNHQLRAKRQMLALDPPGGASRTLGGMLATHASGPLRFRYGTGRDLLLGVRFVQADGTVTWGGARVVKSVTGYDVPKLMVGSLGTLGVIVEATLRLHPIAPASASWLIGFASHEAAGGFIAALVDSPLQPDRVALVNAEARRRSGAPATGPGILVSVGSVQEAVTDQGEALRALAARHGGQSRTVSGAAWATVYAHVEGQVLLRLGCEPRRLIFWLGEVERLGAALAAAPTALGQPGHGVLQVALRGTLPAAGVVSEVIRPLRQGLEAEGGSLVVERAPAELKTLCETWGAILPESLAIMRRVKDEFDPGGILNPGRFVGGL